MTIQGEWIEARVAGHPIDVFEPSVPHPHGYVVLYLHGVHSNRLRDQPAFTEQFARHGLRVAAPMTGRSWWIDRICAEFDPHVSAERHLLERVLPWIEARWGVKPPGIGLLGTSMGGQGALRISYKRPTIFPVVAAIAPAIDFHLRLKEGDPVLSRMYDEVEEARQDTAILHIHPLNWPRKQFFCCDPTDERWIDSADRLRMKLYSLGVPHTCDLSTSGGGHSFAYYSLMAPRAMEFLVQSLDDERRRVV